MRILPAKILTIWQKNSPELLGFFNGSFPEFVTARAPRPLRGAVPVFHYHLVDSNRFEADLRFLSANGYTTIDADELVEFLCGRADIPEHAVLLTFDDGPRNFYEVAFPLLLKYRHKAVIFVAPGLHDATRDGDLDPSWPRPMSWEQLQEIHASRLVQIQSHTFESRHVPTWPRPVDLAGCHPRVEATRRGEPRAMAEDFVAARKLLEQRLPGARVRHLAFPQYDGTADALRVAAETGYVSCFWGMSPNRPLNRRGDSPFEVSRISGEYLRRLPAARRISLPGLAAQRLQIIYEGYKWRSRYAGS